MRPSSPPRRRNGRKPCVSRVPRRSDRMAGCVEPIQESARPRARGDPETPGLVALDSQHSPRRRAFALVRGIERVGVCRLIAALFAGVLTLIVAPAPAPATPYDIAVIVTNETYDGGIARTDYAERNGDAVKKALTSVLGVDEANIQ